MSRFNNEIIQTLTCDEKRRADEVSSDGNGMVVGGWGTSTDIDRLTVTSTVVGEIGMGNYERRKGRREFLIRQPTYGLHQLIHRHRHLMTYESRSRPLREREGQTLKRQPIELSVDDSVGSVAYGSPNRQIVW